MRRLSLFACLALLLASGCDGTGPAYEEQVVVSALLEVDTRLRPVYLTRTVAFGQPVDPGAVLVEDATVTVSLLADDGSVDEVYTYTYDAELLRYRPDTDAQVLPERRYRFAAEVPGRPAITAETVTPPSLQLVQPPPDEIEFDEGSGPTFSVSSGTRDGEQGVYVITFTALAPDDFEVAERDDGSFGYRRAFTEGRFGPTPEYAALIEQINCEPRGSGFACDFEPSDFTKGSSPLINEESYVANPDGSVEVSVPWLAVGFFGPYQFDISVLDAPLVDFVSTQAVQFSPTTLSPGEIPNISSNVTNGLGVFGAYAKVATTTTITGGR